MVGRHLWLIGQWFQQTLADSEEQGSPGSCSPWGHKGSNTTERMNNRTLPQRRHVDVQQAFEEMLNSVNHHTHANKNRNEIQNGCHQKEHSYEVLTRMQSTGNLHELWSERKLVQPIRKAVWSFLKTLKIKLLCYSAVPLLNIYVRRKQINQYEKTCTSEYSLQHDFQQPRHKHSTCPAVDEWKYGHTVHTYIIFLD